MGEHPAGPEDGPESQSSSRQEAPPSRAEKGPCFAAPESAVADLSSRIVHAVDRAAGERVTCRRITGNHYRCNWWSARDTGEYDNPSMVGQMVTTHRVVRSELLRVTPAGGRLVIETVPARGT